MVVIRLQMILRVSVVLSVLPSVLPGVLDLLTDVPCLDCLSFRPLGMFYWFELDLMSSCAQICPWRTLNCLLEVCHPPSGNLQPLLGIGRSPCATMNHEGLGALLRPSPPTSH